MSPPPFRFDLVWPHGRARLELPGAGDPDSDLDAACALAPALAPLAALERWIGMPLDDLRPARTPSPAGAVGLGWGDGGRLLLPPVLLPWGRVPPDELPLVWPAWTVRVRVQSLPLSCVPRAMLRRGALLLLPASFAGEAMAVLLQPAAPMPARTGCWQPRAGRLDLRAAEAPAARPDEAQVWLEAPMDVRASAWFGAEGAAVPLPAGAARLAIAGLAVARGTLVPAGLGWGLLLEDGAAATTAPCEDRTPAWT